MSDDRPALEALGKALLEEMNHLDPTGSRDWESLSPREREFYCFAIDGVLEAHSDLVRRVLDDLQGRDIWERTGWRKAEL